MSDRVKRIQIHPGQPIHQAIITSMIVTCPEGQECEFKLSWLAIHSLLLGKIFRCLLLCIINVRSSLAPQLLVKGGLILVVVDGTFDNLFARLGLLDVSHRVGHLEGNKSNVCQVSEVLSTRGSVRAYMT